MAGGCGERIFIGKAATHQLVGQRGERDDRERQAQRQHHAHDLQHHQYAACHALIGDGECADAEQDLPALHEHHLKHQRDEGERPQPRNQLQTAPQHARRRAAAKQRHDECGHEHRALAYRRGDADEKRRRERREPG